MNVADMQLSELLEMNRAIKQGIQSQKDGAVIYIVDLMKEIGIELNEIAAHLPTKAKRKGSGKTRAPMYRNPSDESQTWCGFGIVPKWFKAHIESGLTKEDMLIS